MLLAESLRLMLLLSSLGRTPEEHVVPVYLPRSASLGLRFGPDTLSPELRLGWEIGLYEVPKNHLVMIVHAEGGVATTTTLGINSLYQYKGLLGIGYRTTRELFHFGFHLAAGAVWYRSGFKDSVQFRFENRVVGHSELRGQVGLRVTDLLIVGLAVTYGLGWQTNIRYPASQYVGGLQVRVFADWS